MAKLTRKMVRVDMFWGTGCGRDGKLWARQANGQLIGGVMYGRLQQCEFLSCFVLQGDFNYLASILNKRAPCFLSAGLPAWL